MKFAFATAILKIETLRMRRRFAACHHGSYVGRSNLMATKKYFVLVLDMELKTHAYPEGLGEITQVYSDGISKALICNLRIFWDQEFCGDFSGVKDFGVDFFRGCQKL